MNSFCKPPDVGSYFFNGLLGGTMRNFSSLLSSPIRLAVLLGFLVSSSLRAGETNDSRFGFTGPEIFPIDPAIGMLHVADLDGDGLNDIVVVNNARSQINLLYNQTGKTNQVLKTARRKLEANELPPDARFRIESIASEKRISSLVVADLNGDGRPDLAYYGEPKELIVLYNLGTNNWSAPKRFPIDDGYLSDNALTTGDLNGDHLTDLILLGEKCVYFLAQNKDHTLAEPVKIPFSGDVRAVQALDIDGDGRDDLLFVSFEGTSPVRFRLQQAGGQLGPEIHFVMPPIRSFTADDIAGDHQTEVVTISRDSGRAHVSGFTRKPAEPLVGSFKQGQFQVWPMPRTSKTRRGVLWADVNGDGRDDLLVAEPASGQLTLYLQETNGSLGAGKTFAAPTGISELASSDWNSDGTTEIFMLSTDEREIGVTHFDKSGRIGFPNVLPLEGTPLAMAVGPLQPGAKPTLAVILDRDGKRFLYTQTADGKSHAQKLSDDFKSNPLSMTLHDANQDGLADLVLLIPYEKVKVLVQQPGKEDFLEADVLSPGGADDPQPWLAVADVDGDSKPELLLPQKNFIRAVVLKQESGTNADAKPSWTFTVKEQINGASSSSHIIGATPLRNGTNAVDSIFLLDADRKALTLCERDSAGVWQVVRNLPVPVTDFQRLRSIGLGSETPNSLAFIGLNSVAALNLSGDVWEFTELDSYETPIKDGRLNDVILGDLNNDHRKELVFMETAKNYLDIVAFDPPHNLVPGIRWQVFEQRTFRSSRNDSMEPREAVVADVTGDKRNDLLVLVHDRILLYPQE